MTNLDDAVTVQFIHRILAYCVFLLSCAISYRFYIRAELKNAALLFCACLVQVAMGVITLVTGVPIAWGLLHQLGAILLISSVIYLLNR